MKRAWLTLIFAALALPLAAQQLFVEGQDYQKLSPAQPDGGGQVEVIEFFWYGCSHCDDFEPYISKWKKERKPANVKLTLVPAIFAPGWAVHAKAYYAAEIMGVLDKTHGLIFDAIHRQKLPHNTAEEIGDIVAKQGIDRQKFLDTMQSFAVETQVRRAEKMIRAYRVQGVPLVAVNGRYTTSGSLAKSYPRMLDVMDFLIQQETGKPQQAKQSAAE